MPGGEPCTSKLTIWRGKLACAPPVLSRVQLSGCCAGIEVTQTHFRDQPERGYQASPPQQDGQYPAYAPQGAYPQAGPYTQQGPYQQPYQQQWQPPPQQWGPPGSGQVEYGFCNRPGVSYPVFVAPADMDDNPIFVVRPSAWASL